MQSTVVKVFSDPGAEAKEVPLALASAADDKGESREVQ